MTKDICVCSYERVNMWVWWRSSGNGVKAESKSSTDLQNLTLNLRFYLLDILDGE